MVPPFITAIMPTRDRPGLLAKAIECFNLQTYRIDRRELVILDDAPGTLSIPEPLGPNVYYMLQPGPALTIGTKRNVLCDGARGEIILHFDDDDWSAPERIAGQVDLLMSNPHVSVTGYNWVTFWDTRDRRAWLYRSAPHYAVGASLAYRKSWWRDHPFTGIQVQEDCRFVNAAYAAKALMTEDGSSLLVARIHSGNTAPKPIGERPCYLLTDSVPPGFHP